MGYMDHKDFSILKDKILHQVLRDGDEVIFKTKDGEIYKLTHNQDCCESVLLEEVHGDLQDLIGHPILCAEKVASDDGPKQGYDPESYTWTFYKLATIKGSVTLRWYGTSNGYYSESVDFEQVK